MVPGVLAFAMLGIMQFVNGRVLAFIPWLIEMKVTGWWKIAHFPTPPLITDFTTGDGMIQMLQRLSMSKRMYAWMDASYYM